jgi:hypothetical protein
LDVLPRVTTPPFKLFLGSVRDEDVGWLDTAAMGVDPRLRIDKSPAVIVSLRIQETK